MIPVTLKKLAACTISKLHNENAANEAINISHKQQRKEQTTDCMCKSFNWIGRAVRLHVYIHMSNTFSYKVSGTIKGSSGDAPLFAEFFFPKS